MPKQEEPRWKVIASVNFYIVSALSMVMINKWVLTSSNIPLTFLALQILITILLLHLVRRFGFIEFSLPAAASREIVNELKYLILLNVFGLISSTYTLALVDASFYQVARGLVLPFTVLASPFFLKSYPSRKILLACTVITIGFIIGIAPSSISSMFGGSYTAAETTISSTSSGVRGFAPLGIFFGLTGSLCTAIHVIIIKQSLITVSSSVMDLAWYTNILTFLLLLPLIVLIEFSNVIEFLFTATSGEMTRFCTGTIATGLGGFLISVAGILSVKVTSPITHMVSSTARGVAQTALGIWFFEDVLTISKTFSIGTILTGSIWYIWIKHTESLPSPSNLPLSNPSAKSGTQP